MTTSKWTVEKRPHAICSPRKAMVSTPIERIDWPGYFESFTLQHSGWLVSVDGEKATMPLERIVARDDGRVVIHLGNDVAHHRIITIDAASVRATQSNAAGQILEIESTDGHRTHLALVEIYHS